MKKLAIAVVSALMLVALSALPAPAGAATLVVDDDGADCPEAAYATIQAAVDAASPGDTIKVCTGTYAGATVNKAVHLVAAGNVVINTGPNTHPFLRAGFFLPPGGSASGATIRGFTFVGTAQSDYRDDGKLDFPVFSRGANNVTVEHNRMTNSLQAITNLHGSGWTIQHNTIEGLWVLCPGSATGIIIGSSNGTGASDNLIAYNTIQADASPCGASYTTSSGINVYSDRRGARVGGPVKGNRVLHNRSRVSGTWQGAPAADGLEMTDGGLLIKGNADVTGNTVAFNDFRGSSIEMLFSPEQAENNNTVSRNLGANRGHGVVPAHDLFE